MAEITESTKTYNKLIRLMHSQIERGNNINLEYSTGSINLEQRQEIKKRIQESDRYYTVIIRDEGGNSIIFCKTNHKPYLPSEIGIWNSGFIEKWREDKSKEAKEKRLKQEEEEKREKNKEIYLKYKNNRKLLVKVLKTFQDIRNIEDCERLADELIDFQVTSKKNRMQEKCRLFAEKLNAIVNPKITISSW